MLQQHWALDSTLDAVSGERDSNFSGTALLAGGPTNDYYMTANNEAFSINQHPLLLNFRRFGRISL